MKTIIHSFKEKLFLVYLYIVLVFVILALVFNMSIFIMDVSGYEDKVKQITNSIMFTIDGRYKNFPGNIYYNEKSVAIGLIVNKVKMGPLLGNRNLEFGVQNILEEALQDKGFDIDHASANRIEIDIVYLDVLKTQSSMSVFHKDKEAVVIRLMARYYEGDKLSKKINIEESAEEVSVSTLVIDKGGKFNQQNLSSALKKAVVAVVNKL